MESCLGPGILVSFFSRFLRCEAAATNVTPLFLLFPVLPRQSWQSQSSLAGGWPHGTDVVGSGASAPSSVHIFNFSLSRGSLLVAHKRVASGLSHLETNSSRHICSGSLAIPAPLSRPHGDCPPRSPKIFSKKYIIFLVMKVIHINCRRFSERIYRDRK